MTGCVNATAGAADSGPDDGGRHVLLVVVLLSIAGCVQPSDGYLPATAIARNGFLIDQPAGAEAAPREIKVWGFVDHGNLYGNDEAKEILREWWGGEGPDVRSWRFDLKGAADDAVGRSFPVHVPNDVGRDDLLRRFVADARAERPTKVFVTGSMSTFHAPTQALDLTGLYLQLRSSQDIRLESVNGD